MQHAILSTVAARSGAHVVEMTGTLGLEHPANLRRRVGRRQSCVHAAVAASQLAKFRTHQLGGVSCAPRTVVILLLTGVPVALEPDVERTVRTTRRYEICVLQPSMEILDH